ncbi:hypothetical protein ACWC9R_14880 [Streptomyces sp. NPDC001219]
MHIVHAGRPGLRTAAQWRAPRKAKPPLPDAAVALLGTVLDEGNWYTHLSLLGRVADLREDDELADIDRLARHYLGKPYPQRDRRRFSAWIEIDRWHGWGSLKDSSQAG